MINKICGHTSFELGVALALFLIGLGNHVWLEIVNKRTSFKVIFVVYKRMVAAWNLYIACSVLGVDEPLELSMWNVVWKSKPYLQIQYKVNKYKHGSGENFCIFFFLVQLL